MYCNEHQIEINYNIKPEFQDDECEETIALWLIKNGFQIPYQWHHDPTIQDKQGNTVTMYLAQFKRQIPSDDWHHDPEIKNMFGNTVAIMLLIQGTIPPTQWMHDINLQNNVKQSIKSILKQKCLSTPQYWNDNGNDIFYQAILRQIPDITGHQSNEQNEDGFTVAMILAYNNIDIPKQWFHDPSIQNKHGQTVAMIQILKGQIPDKQWIHNKYLRCKFYGNYCTVQNILKYKHIQVPEEWKYVPLNKYEDNQAMFDARNGIIPELGDNDPCYQNKYGWTVAMLLAEKYNISYLIKSTINYTPVPQQWCHKPELQNNEGITIAMILASRMYIPPQQWNHDPNLQNNYGCTVAMQLARRGIIPPKQWYHKGYLLQKYGLTTAMFIVKYCNQIPSNQWYHDPNIRDIVTYKTVAMNIIYYCHQLPPKQWYHRPELQDEDGMTTAMYIAKYLKQIPPEELEHDPNLKNNKDETVALLLASNGYVPDKQWTHNKYLRCKYEIQPVQDYCCEYIYYYYTVQNILQSQNIEVPEEWRYEPLNNYEDNQAMIDARNGIIPELGNNNPLDINKCGDTVAILLASNGIVPPKEWMHDVDLQNNRGQTIKSLLFKYCYIYKDNKFIPTYKIQKLNDICQLCFNNDEQEFIITFCGHNICVNCFQKLIKSDNTNKCPVCRKQNWYEKLL